MDIILLVIFIVGFAAVIFFLFKQSQKPQDNQSALLLQQQINDLNKQLSQKMDDSSHHASKMLQDQFMETSRLSQEVKEKLLKLEETNKQVVSFTDQLQQLQDILKNPKQRGILGEYYLETVLKNVLPPESYSMQYNLGKSEDGSTLIPDAVVFIKDRILPIDAKFSLENYNRLSSERDENERSRLEKVFVNDLKQRIKETAKYILPDKKTMDFAFMFIPHEAIYYDLLTNKIGLTQADGDRSLIEQAATKYRVLIVSPTTFLAYLQTVLQGLRALKIEESAKDILKNVLQLQKHIETYSESYKKLGNQLGTVVNTYNSTNKEFKHIDKDILRISGQGGILELEEIDKPRLE